MQEFSFPSDVNQLRTLVAELHKEKDNYEVENRLLRERIKQLTHQLYGRKSEKLLPDDNFEQSGLFDDIGESNEAEPATVDEIITIPSHTRKKKVGARFYPSLLPV